MKPNIGTSLKHGKQLRKFSREIFENYDHKTIFPRFLVISQGEMDSSTITTQSHHPSVAAVSRRVYLDAYLKCESASWEGK